MHVRARTRPRTRVPTWTHASASIHTQTNVILSLIHSNNAFENAPKCYLLCTLPVLSNDKLIVLLVFAKQQLRLLYTHWSIALMSTLREFLSTKYLKGDRGGVVERKLKACIKDRLKNFFCRALKSLRQTFECQLLFKTLKIKTHKLILY